MTSTKIEISLNQDNISSLTTDDKGNYVAITKKGKIISSYLNEPLENEYNAHYASIIDEDFLLIVSDTNKERDNARIIDMQGKVKTSFCLGHFINNILIKPKRIIVSYFDQGVMAKYIPDQEAVAVFNFKGELLYGFNSSTKSEELMDCYCLASFGSNKIVFNGYGNFDLQELDLNTFETISYEIPSECIGASSISTSANLVIFYGPYKDKTSFYIWNIQTKELRKISSNLKDIKATSNGTFYSFENKSFTLINPLD